MRETPRRLLALATLVAVLATPVARVVLDAGAPPPVDHVESTHDSDRCRAAHHHAACVQLFASAAAPARDSVGPGAGAEARFPAGLAAGRSGPAPVPADTRPRAPPLLPA